MNEQIFTYVYLHESAIHIKDMTEAVHQKNFDLMHVLHRWSNIKHNYDNITTNVDEIAKRAKLQVIDHRSRE